MDKEKYIQVAQEELMNLLDERSSFWTTEDEFAHYARIIKEDGFLDQASKDRVQKALQGWGGDVWDMTEMLVGVFFDNEMKLPDNEQLFATLVLYLFYADKFIAFKNI